MYCSREHLPTYTLHGEPLIFQHFDGPYFPTLRLLHKRKCAIQFYYYYSAALTTSAGRSPLLSPLWRFFCITDPFIFPHVHIDHGTIRFLLAGTHVMCPGLTSAGGSLPADTPVAFDVEGKESAVGIGLTNLGMEDMNKVNKGVAVE